MTEDKALKNKFQSSLSLLDSYIEQRGVLLVSGGVDSMVLLDAVLCYQPKIKLECIHFNYQLRGDESFSDEAFVKQECLKKGVPLIVEQVKIESKNGIQDKARQIRYERVAQLAKKQGWTFALTAHHADDQIETLLMRIKRGSGLRGLQGIHQKRRIHDTDFLRPLLMLSKEEIHQYAGLENILYVEDSSNAKNNYLRNRVRHQQLPQFKNNIGNQVEQLITSSLSIQKEMQILHKHVDVFFDQFKSGGCHHIEKKIFKELDSTVRFLLLERIFSFYGFNKELNQCHVLEIEKNIEAKRNSNREYGPVEIFFDSQYVHVTKKNQVSVLKREIKFDEYGSHPWLEQQTISLNRIQKQNWSGPQKGVLSFSAHTLHWPLIVRMPQAGERFVPYGRKGSKKVSDFLIEKKITGYHKRSFPIICDQKSIIGVVGLDISDEYQVDENTDQVCLCYTQGNEFFR
ncbi:MAG: tRNA(Ile)-lysidine synthetase [uncultured bacterium]|nr:MAG: tRNA(Ile)-lysidine synthetase [uncultured bacterium]